MANSFEIKRERDSNFELCRLICMLYIVIYHMIIHVPGLYENTMWGRPLRTICHIGVVVFVMISGYYGIRRKWQRLLELALSVSFYNILGILIATQCFNQPFDINSLLTVFFPITKGGYWFITSYVVLYMLAPYINLVLEKLDRRDFLIFLLVFAIVVWYGGGIWSNNIGHGRGIMAFVLSYGIGFFLKRFYGSGNLLKLHMGALYWVISLIIFACVAFLPSFFSKAINYLCFGYNEIGLYVMSVLFLLMFQNIRIKSRIINWSATSVLGIYLIHENANIRSLFVHRQYETLFMNNIENQWLLLCALITYALVIVIGCVFIDKFRQILFNFLRIKLQVKTLSDR